MANCLPSALQTMVPGAEQVLLPEEPEVESVDGAVAAAAAAGEAATEGAAAATGDAATEGAAAAAGEAATEGAAAAAGEEASGEAASAPKDELPEEALDDEPPEAAPQLGPVGGARSEATPSFSTEVPGSGNWTSLESAVKQSEVGMFATNMAGKEGVSRPASSGMAKSVSLR